MQANPLQPFTADTIEWDNRPAVNALLQSLDNKAKLEQLALGLSEHPGNPFLLGHLGKTWLALGDPNLAIEHLRQAVNAEPTNASLLFSLGLAYSKSGNTNEALVWLHEAVDNGDNADHTLLLIRTYADQSEIAPAIAACKRGLHNHPNDARFKSTYANMLHLRGETERALHWLTLNDTNSHSELAWLRYQFSSMLGKADIAKRTLDEYHLRLLQTQPNYRERALNTLNAVPDRHAKKALAMQWKQTLQPLLSLRNQTPLRVAMSILVRDEADIIAHNIRYHAAAGVKHFVVTDNGSVDGTREILQQLQSEFSIDIIDEPAFTIDQDLWVTRMAKLICNMNQFDWIIHNDADEFWVPSAGQQIPEAIQHSLSQASIKHDEIGILNCKRFNMLTCKEQIIESDYQFYLNKHVVLKDVPLADGQEKWNNNSNNTVARFVMDKVMTRTDGLGNIEYGNHGASHDLQAVECNSINILHFPIRSYSQFERKVVNYGRSLENNTRFKQGSSAHLRYWYKRYKQGKLEQDYDQITFSNAQLQELEKTGHVIQNELLFDFFDSSLFIA